MSGKAEEAEELQAYKEKPAGGHKEEKESREERGKRKEKITKRTRAAGWEDKTKGGAVMEED